MSDVLLNSEKNIQVAIPRRIWHSLSYKTTDTFQPGTFIKVPLKKQTTWGLVIRESGPKDLEHTPTVKSIEHPQPHPITLSKPFLTWLHDVSRHYHHPFGLMAKMACPTPILNLSFEKIVPPVLETPPDRKKHDLNDSQAKLVSAIQSDIQADRLNHLIYGVTGSGKTEIYIHLAHRILEAGKTVLLLVPEIALTPQLVSRISKQLAHPLITLHSNLTPKQHREAWLSAFFHSSCLVVGTRSALFHPLPNLGMIIMDEEHDGSYKQSDHLRYHARDIVKRRAAFESIPWIMGSATPSYEALTLCQADQVIKHRLPHRHKHVALPTLSLIQAPRNPYQAGWLSQELKEAVTETLENQEQSLLFLNRKGFAPYLTCQSCNQWAQCSNCDTTLTYYRKQSQCVCHLCGKKTPPPTHCTECRSPFMIFKGAGTEAIEAEIRTLFPEATLARIDRDEVTSFKDLETLFEDATQGRIDILIGTQMLAKGHDLPHLTLVGILNGDQTLHHPDFRSVERTAQLIQQVSGRSGRTKPGRVFIQTLGHPLLEKIIHTDYIQLYEEELSKRKEYGLPPMGYLGRFVFDALGLQQGLNGLSGLSPLLNSLRSTHKALTIVPPSPCIVERIARRFRIQILIKSSDYRSFHTAIHHIQRWAETQYPRRVLLDISPQEFL